MPKKQQKQSKKQSNGQGDKEVFNFDNPDFEFIPKGNHEYRQQGPYLICYSCVLQHAVWVGMEKIMVGIDKDGQPILKDKEFN